MFPALHAWNSLLQLPSQPWDGSGSRLGPPHTTTFIIYLPFVPDLEHLALISPNSLLLRLRLCLALHFAS